ncbi:nucleolar protein 7 [Biomphalaria glabrata]|nr:nucleolar protein 7 [Biomphalaria glabrata]
MDTFDSCSDSDDAPEEFNVAQVRQHHVSQLKDFQELLKKSKQEEKEKRRKRNELFKAQKEKKIQELQKRKLPQEVLDAVSSKASLPKEAGKVIAETQVDEEVTEDLIDDDLDDRLADSGVEDDNEFDTKADFIPLKGTKNLFVATDEVVKKKKLMSAQEVLNFKNSRLYDQSVIPRENSKQRRSKAARLKILRNRK